MNYYIFILGGILIFGLIRDFGKDKGRYLWEKVAHVIGLAGILYLFNGSIGRFLRSIGNIEHIKNMYFVEMSFLPPAAYLVLKIASTVLGAFILYQAYRMIHRADKGRFWFIRLAGSLVVINLIIFAAESPLHLIQTQTYWEEFGDKLAISIAPLALILLYRSQFMLRFFHRI